MADQKTTPTWLREQAKLAEVWSADTAQRLRKAATEIEALQAALQRIADRNASISGQIAKEALAHG